MPVTVVGREVTWEAERKVAAVREAVLRGAAVTVEA